MMFGRGASRRDRAIISTKVAAPARKSPGGWWRIAKNAARHVLLVTGAQVSMGAWTALLTRGGLVGATTRTIVADAELVTGRRPESPVRGETLRPISR